jgi:hypothetical protein
MKPCALTLYRCFRRNCCVIHQVMSSLMTEESCFSEPSVNVALRGVLTQKTTIFLAQTWNLKPHLLTIVCAQNFRGSKMHHEGKNTDFLACKQPSCCRLKFGSVVTCMTYFGETSAATLRINCTLFQSSFVLLHFVAAFKFICIIHHFLKWPVLCYM